jgi:hypothetical protein
MTVSVNYPSPVMVNGYSCKNCTDVDYAKKNIDPAHPKDGPFGIDAKANGKTGDAAARPPAVTFGGALAGTAGLSQGATPSATQGLRLDVSV